MIIFALDTSSKAASCALWRDGALWGESFVNAGLTHSQTIMPMAQSLLDRVGCTLDQVDRFAVTVGPGSFTGLRIGIASVKGMAMAADKPCAAVSTLESLAWNLRTFRGIILPVMDARCGQVYTAWFRSGDSVPQRMEADCAIPIARLGDRLRELGDIPIMLVGDGAELCMRELWEHIPGLRLSPEPLRHQRAGSVAEIAARIEALLPARHLEPAYLRLPQAERELIKKKEMERHDRTGK